MIRIVICASIVLHLVTGFAQAGQKKVLSVTFKKSGSYTLAMAQNQTYADMTVAFTLILENMKSDTGTKFTINLPAKKTVTIAKLSVANPAKRYRYSYRYRWRHGRYKAKHNDKYNYALPFARGRAYYISQGYFGTFSHKKGTHSQFALDFKMPIGTPVCAARDGVVFASEDRYTTGGKATSFKGKVNYIKIMHDDGTYAAYLHLRPKGVAVKLGQRVKRGQLIGYSGNTGWSTVPHLHFDVRRVHDVEAYETIPTAFTTNTQKRSYLRSGFTYGNPK